MFKPHQYIASVHSLASFNQYLKHFTIAWRRHTAFHFHGLHDDQFLTTVNPVPLLNADIHNKPWHGAFQNIVQNQLLYFGHELRQFPFLGAVNLKNTGDAAKSRPYKITPKLKAEHLRLTIDIKLDAPAVKFQLRRNHLVLIAIGPDGPGSQIRVSLQPKLKNIRFALDHVIVPGYGPFRSADMS